MLLGRFTREIRSEIPNDYVVFLHNHENDIEMIEKDPINFRQAMTYNNDIWDLVSLPEGVKSIDSKWIFETQRDS